MSDDITTRLFTVNDPEHPHYLESGHLTGEGGDAVGETNGEVRARSLPARC